MLRFSGNIGLARTRHESGGGGWLGEIWLSASVHDSWLLPAAILGLERWGEDARSQRAVSGLALSR